MPPNDLTFILMRITISAATAFAFVTLASKDLFDHLTSKKRWAYVRLLMFLLVGIIATNAVWLSLPLVFGVK